jgi:hypothetical protein
MVRRATYLLRSRARRLVLHHVTGRVDDAARSPRPLCTLVSAPVRVAAISRPAMLRMRASRSSGVTTRHDGEAAQVMARV